MRLRPMVDPRRDCHTSAMLSTEEHADQVHKHLAEAALALGDWIASADPRDRHRLTEIARLCTRAQEQLLETSLGQKAKAAAE